MTGTGTVQAHPLHRGLDDGVVPGGVSPVRGVTGAVPSGVTQAGGVMWAALFTLGV